MPVEIIPLLPSSLMKVPHIAAFDPLIRNYVSSDTDLALTQQGVPGNDPIETVINILNIDTCPVEILPYLAEMFGVEGFKGFDYATTEEQQRNMLRNAPQKHEYHGSIWTLRTALEDAGYRNVIIDDHLYTLFINGSWSVNGTLHIASNSWADFAVTVNAPVGVLPADVDIAALTKYINYWKRGSSRLVGITIAQIILSNLSVGPGPVAQRTINGTWYTDGTYQIGN